MKAVQVHSFGGPDVMSLEEMVLPEPGPFEARVKVEAIGVNFVDVYYRTGQYQRPLPLIPGMEAAGIVDVVGPKCAGPAPGTRVAYAMQLGSYAEYTIVPTDRLVVVPDEISISDAAATMLQGMTAHFLSHDLISLGAGDTVVVHAAAGGLGQLLTQMLKRRGSRVIATVSTARKAELAAQAGADDVVNYSETDFASAVRRLTGGEGAAAVYDSVGLNTWRGSLECVRSRGWLVLCGQSSGLVPPIDPQLLRTHGSVILSRPSLTHYIANRGELNGRARDVFSWLRTGELRMRIDDVLPLGQAAGAHRRLESRTTTGKLLLVP